MSEQHITAEPNGPEGQHLTTVEDRDPRLQAIPFMTPAEFARSRGTEALLEAEIERLRDALTTIAGMRQEADDWQHPDFDWRMIARKQEQVARAAAEEQR